MACGSAHGGLIAGPQLLRPVFMSCCTVDIEARRLCVTAAQPNKNDVDKVAQLSDGLRPICWDGLG
jgi:hypothetical protein